MTKSIEPNASLLIILTKEIRNNCEKVLFVYLKELEDILKILEKRIAKLVQQNLKK